MHKTMILRAIPLLTAALLSAPAYSTAGDTIFSNDDIAKAVRISTGIPDPGIYEVFGLRNACMIKRDTKKAWVLLLDDALNGEASWKQVDILLP